MVCTQGAVEVGRETFTIGPPIRDEHALSSPIERRRHSGKDVPRERSRSKIEASGRLRGSTQFVSDIEALGHRDRARRSPMSFVQRHREDQRPSLDGHSQEAGRLVAERRSPLTRTIPSDAVGVAAETRGPDLSQATGWYCSRHSTAAAKNAVAPCRSAPVSSGPTTNSTPYRPAAVAASSTHFERLL